MSYELLGCAPSCVIYGRFLLAKMIPRTSNFRPNVRLFECCTDLCATGVFWQGQHPVTSLNKERIASRSTPFFSPVLRSRSDPWFRVRDDSLVELLIFRLRRNEVEIYWGSGRRLESGCILWVSNDLHAFGSLEWRNSNFTFIFYKVDFNVPFL